jgi:hypothetical protein
VTHLFTMRNLTTLSLAAALMLGASSVHAEMKQVERAGVWTAFAGTADDGLPMCRMSSTADVRYVHVKWTISGLFLHVVKLNWRIPAGTEMPMTIRFDQEESFKGTAKRRLDQSVEFRIPETLDARRFVDQFATADRMRITFSGNEREWVMGMDGSDTVAQKFTRCVAVLKKKMGPATQPFDADETPQAQPSQPFDSQPKQRKSTEQL